MPHDAELQQQLLHVAGQTQAVGGVVDPQRVALVADDAAVALEQRHEKRLLQAGCALPHQFRHPLRGGPHADLVGQHAAAKVGEVVHVELVQQPPRAAVPAGVDIPRPADEPVVRGQDLVEEGLVEVVEAGPLLRAPTLGDPASEEDAQSTFLLRRCRRGRRGPAKADHRAGPDLVEPQPLEHGHAEDRNQTEDGVVRGRL